MAATEPRALRFAIIGAGMAGILSAIKLTEAGYDDFTVYEKADRPGGTWRENTYPGIACDVPSHLYSYSFALNPDWSARFSEGPEIQRYFERVAAEHDVDSRTRYGDAVARIEWGDGRWHLTTEKGHTEDVDVVIAATGVLHHPNYPDIPGVDDFEGVKFHSARWDHSVPLDGKRIGVIGNGSSGVQITGALASRASEYTLFQRTAQWIMPWLNPPYSDEEKAEFQDPTRLRTEHETLADQFDQFANGVVDAGSEAMQVVEAMCKDNLEQSVKDPVLREKLRPDYRPACKRLVASPNFYDAIQHPNAELVTEPIERIEAKGVRTKDGVLHELDILVLATGFHVQAFMRPMEVIGRNGLTLDEAWAKRPSAYLSISIPEFPNLFMLNGPNGPVGNFSLIGVAELQHNYILQLVERLRAGEGQEICATHEATDAFDEERTEAAGNTIWATGCRSWYLDDRGVPMVWPFKFSRFREEMAAPKFEAYELA
jgi:cation diffusion facilitator CzcD-associated flavoprotein CzcO